MVRRRDNDENEGALDLLEFKNKASISAIQDGRMPYMSKISNSSSALSADIQKHGGTNLMTKKRWKKLLWVHQEYPDNYVDSSFLSQLRRNSTVTKYSYWKLVNDFGLITIHLCDTCLVIIVFYGMYHQHWSSPFLPTFVFTILTISLYFLCDQLSCLTNRAQNGANAKLNKNSTYIDQNGEVLELRNREIKQHYIYEKLATLKSSLLIVFIVLTLSPVLRSLTNSTSSDSIWALSTWLTIVNIICHNYVYDIQKEDDCFKLSALSTNVIFANVIVLSSRLDSNMAVFCFILISIEIHGLFPIFQFKLRRFFNIKNAHVNSNTKPIYATSNYSIISNSDKFGVKKRYNRKTNSSFTFGAFYFTLVSLFLYYTFHSNIIIIVLWFIINFFITFFCPGYFIFLQQYKNELQGPWDPAKPNLFNEF